MESGKKVSELTVDELREIIREEINSIMRPGGKSQLSLLQRVSERIMSDTEKGYETAIERIKRHQSESNVAGIISFPDEDEKAAFKRAEEDLIGTTKFMIPKKMEFIITSVKADTKASQEKRDVLGAKMLGQKSFEITLSIDLVSAGDASEVWDMEKPEADAYIAKKIIEKFKMEI